MCTHTSTALRGSEAEHAAECQFLLNKLAHQYDLHIPHIHVSALSRGDPTTICNLTEILEKVAAVQQEEHEASQAATATTSALSTTTSLGNIKQHRGRAASPSSSSSSRMSVPLPAHLIPPQLAHKYKSHTPRALQSRSKPSLGLDLSDDDLDDTQSEQSLEAEPTSETTGSTSSTEHARVPRDGLGVAHPLSSTSSSSISDLDFDNITSPQFATPLLIS